MGSSLSAAAGRSTACPLPPADPTYYSSGRRLSGGEARRAHDSERIDPTTHGPQDGQPLQARLDALQRPRHPVG